MEKLYPLRSLSLFKLGVVGKTIISDDKILQIFPNHPDILFCKVQDYLEKFNESLDIVDKGLCNDSNVVYGMQCKGYNSLNFNLNFIITFDEGSHADNLHRNVVKMKQSSWLISIGYGSKSCQNQREASIQFGDILFKLSLQDVILELRSQDFCSQIVDIELRITPLSTSQFLKEAYVYHISSALIKQYKSQQDIKKLLLESFEDATKLWMDFVLKKHFTNHYQNNAKKY